MTTPNSPGSSRKSSLRAALGMTLALMLCCAGCTWSRGKFSPSVSGPLGNAVAATLPVGAELHLSPEFAQELGQVLANESQVKQPGVIVTTMPLKICTSEYLEERDLAEMALLMQINALRTRLKAEAPK